MVYDRRPVAGQPDTRHWACVMFHQPPAHSTTNRIFSAPASLCTSAVLMTKTTKKAMVDVQQFQDEDAQ